MKINIELVIDTDRDDPNTLGEYLRGYIFDQGEDGYGCYTTFDLNDWVTGSSITARQADKELEYNLFAPDPFWGDSNEEMNKATCFMGNLTHVAAYWLWDGDGHLVFKLTRGNEKVILENTDCKKSYVWKWVEFNTSTDYYAEYSRGD